jgi:hypothetical protein
MASSLDSLLKNVTNHHNLGKFYTEPDQKLLLLKKGVDCVDSIEWFSKTQLPPKEAFYSKLNGAAYQMRSMLMPRKYGRHLI